MTEKQSIEEMIEAANPQAPRITPDHLPSLITPRLKRTNEKRPGEHELRGVLRFNCVSPSFSIQALAKGCC